MNRRALAMLLPLLFGVSPLNSMAAGQQDFVAVAKPGLSQLHGMVTKDSNNPGVPILEQYGLSCIKETNAPLPALIVDIKKGTIGEARGLQISDRVISIRAAKSGLNLGIERGGKNYCVNMDANKLNSATAVAVARPGLLGGINHSELQANTDKSDLSDMKAKMDRANHPFSAQAVAQFGHAGVIQGRYPNCWFEASVAAVADTPQGQRAISEMITSSGSEYVVAFPGVPEKVEVVSSDLTARPLQDPAQWAQILECAETQVYPDNAPGATGAMRGNPGVKVGLEMMTGKPVSFIRPDSLSQDELSELLARVTHSGAPMVVATKSPAEHQQYFQPIVPNHAYTVLGYDSASGYVTLRNPLGHEARALPPVQRLGVDTIRVDLQTMSTFIRFIAWPES